MTRMKNFASAESAPTHLREYARKVEALAQKVIDTVNAAGETDAGLVLDVLINVYINAGHAYGRELECANRMVQIGGQMLLRDALLQQAAAAPSSPTRH